MKKLITPVCAAALAAVCIAQEPSAAPAPQAAPAQKQAPQRVMRRPRRPDMGRRMSMFGAPVKPFGKLKNGETAKIYRIQGRGGLILDVTDYGGRLVRCYAPDKFGNLADVTLGWNTPAEYEQNGFSMGTLIGRYGNRIADGKFTLDGKEYQLPINEDKKTAATERHCNLHGGPEGWDKKIWSARPLRMGPVQGIELTYVSKDGEMGFPGTVTCKVRYRVLPNNVWSVEYEATTDKPTILNLTHHSYWNLAGEASGSVLGQELQIFADRYTDVDDGLIPIKDLDVKGTGFDFTTSRAIGAMADWMAKNEHLKPMDNWYDHNFVLRGAMGALHPAATMKDPVSGRRLERWAGEPCRQKCSARNMADP